VTLLSFVFANEQIGGLGFLGIAIACVGAVLMSFGFEDHTVDAKPPVETRGKIGCPIAPDVYGPGSTSEQCCRPKDKRDAKPTLLSMGLMVALLGTSEFCIKIGTDVLRPLEVTAITTIVYGATLTGTLVFQKTRRRFVEEVRCNWTSPVIGESLMFASNAMLACAMASLPAPIVSAFSASAPLFTLVLESCFGLSERGSTRNFLLYRLVPIAVSVCGVGILTHDIF
jgi:drug/metabolite transporter (DMT)-like permease